MFMVTETEALALWQAYKVGGEAEALAALRRVFPFLSPSDEERALHWVHSLIPSRRAASA